MTPTKTLTKNPVAPAGAPYALFTLHPETLCT